MLDQAIRQLQRLEVDIAHGLIDLQSGAVRAEIMRSIILAEAVREWLRIAGDNGQFNRAGGSAAPPGSTGSNRGGYHRE